MSPQVSKCLRRPCQLAGNFQVVFACVILTHIAAFLTKCDMNNLIRCYIQVAMRVAEEKGCLIGQEVGYRIRFDDCTDAQKTAIKVRIKPLPCQV